MSTRRRLSTRYAVTINGEVATLHFIKGLYEKTGILLPGEGGKTFVATQRNVTRAIERTRSVADRLRRSIVSEFIQAKAPELKPLFGPLKFDAQPVHPPAPASQ